MILNNSISDNKLGQTNSIIGAREHGIENQTVRLPDNKQSIIQSGPRQASSVSRSLQARFGASKTSYKKPDKSYKQLIYEALESSPNRQLTLDAIYRDFLK